MNTNSVTNTVSQDSINNILIEILRGAKNVGTEVYGVSKIGIANAIEFATKNATPLVNEFLTWHFIRSCIFASIAATIAAGLIYFVYFLVKYLNKPNTPSQDAGPVFTISLVAGIVAIVSINVCINYVMDCIQIKAAPSIYMIEWVTSQVKR